MNTNQLRTPLFMGLLLVAGTALADKSDLSFEANAGLEHDSNVSVQELDRAAGTADTARLLNARIAGELQPTDRLTLKAGYRYATKAYREFNDFDQTVGTLSLDASYDFSLLALGSSYHRAKADLADDPFLELEQRSVYAGKLINNRVYLRAALNRKEKTFDNNPGRDAEGRGLDGDLFVFFNGTDSFLSFGITNESEDAVANEFDYDALGFRSRFSNRFSWLGKDNKLELSWRYTERDYSAINLLFGARRDDTRRSTEASWEMALTPTIAAVGSVEYGNYESNLESADYRETLTSIMLKASF